jgi:ubiquinone/menaquinone biosynthesis C-methylase UbiE
MHEEHAWEAGAAEWVERVRAGVDGHGHAQDDAVRSLLPSPKGLAVDVGCGEGRWTRALRAAGHETVGVDRSETLIDEARKADPEGAYEVATIDALPFADGAAALVLCVNVLPHVLDLERAATELVRVCAADGVLVLGLAHPVAEAGTLARSRTSSGWHATSPQRSTRSHSATSTSSTNTVRSSSTSGRSST